MKKITLGVLAHVDAGKTTLSEAILYLTGTTRKAGRVDSGDTFLDTDRMEIERGITVFSKEARFRTGDLEVTLVDTPGHADFSAEMERALSVLDLALLVVSGAEGVQSHTITLLKLFKAYGIPVAVFVNKMDMPGTDREAVLKDIRKHLPEAVDFSEIAEKLVNDPEYYRACMSDPAGVLLTEASAEEAATCSEKLMESYLDGGISIGEATEAVGKRELFPVTFGSALKMDGIEGLLKVLEVFSPVKTYPEGFSATVYKITRDANGNRLTNLRVTGGILKNKMQIETGVSGEDEEKITEKAEQIRLYNGDKFTTVNQAEAGTVCAVLGLKSTYAGQKLGHQDEEDSKPFIEPALTYTLSLPGGEDPVSMLTKMRELEEEDPALKVSWEERTKEIKVSIMGELEKDLLIYRIKERFGIDAELVKGRVIYKETISEPVIGIGHYEPLRHYAEVRLLLEPLPEGAGLVFESQVSEDELAKNWQRLIMKHLLERRHKGTLTGSEITDMRISIIAGRAHLKHTEGGDFRQATYRAVRNGLRKALSEGNEVLLEPMYDFTVSADRKYIGRILTDMDRLGASCRLEEDGADGIAVIRGRGPVSTLSEYQMELNAFSEGTGRFMALPGGYGPCHDQDEVSLASGYDPDSDIYNPCGSVFTDHGAGVYVEWDRVEELAHTEGGLRGLNAEQETSGWSDPSDRIEKGTAGNDEKMLKSIFEKTYGKSKRDEQLLKEARSRSTRQQAVEESNYPKPNPKTQKGKGKTYLVVDGYNVLYAWEEFRDIREANIDGAREALIEILQNYQGYAGTGMTLVFDGYKLKTNPGEDLMYGDLNVVYTGEGKTADRFIEEFSSENGKKYDITVVTSDRMVQMSSLGYGSGRLSSAEFHAEVTGTIQQIRDIIGNHRESRNRPFEELLET